MGASPNKGRDAYLAAELLTEHGHEIVPLGIKKGEVSGKLILDIRQQPTIDDVDTITMYVGPRHQPSLYEYLLSLKPARMIFNPGSENEEFERLASQKGIDVEEACTLVLLRTGQY